MLHRPIFLKPLPDSALWCSEELLIPGRRARWIASVRRRGLDEALSSGDDPASSPVIAARAAQLNSRSTRRRLADGLERLALSVDQPLGRARIRPPREAMLVNRAELLELAVLLRSGRPLYAQGVAKLEMLLGDGTGPAYTDRRGEALALALDHARASLEG